VFIEVSILNTAYVGFWGSGCWRFLLWGMQWSARSGAK